MERKNLNQNTPLTGSSTGEPDLSKLTLDELYERLSFLKLPENYTYEKYTQCWAETNIRRESARKV